MSQVLKESLAKNAKDAKVFLGGLGVFARENVFFMPRQSEICSCW
jgi:hypothetical protein